MITAEEAFKEAVVKLEEQQTIDELLKIDAAIKDACFRGYFVTISPLLKPLMAEKVAIELEEFGYNTNVVLSGVMTEQGERLAQVQISWRYTPSIQSRVKSQPCN